MANSTTIESFEPMYAALEQLGLTENERRLYTTSLQMGPTSITVLAQQLGLPRPNLYKIIASLVENGLVDTVRAHHKKFTVEPPQKISELLRIKREQELKIDHAFIEKLPVYLANFKQGESPLKIKMLVGRKDFERLYAQMYEEAQGAIKFCGSFRDFGATFGMEYVVKNVKKRLEKNIKGQALLIPSDRGYLSSEEHRKHQREVRYLDGAAPFATSFHVFSNKVVFWQPKVPMAVLIEDEYLVAMMKSLYEYLWVGAKLA